MEHQHFEIEDIIRRIPDASFVVIDCEFSGISQKSKSIRTIDDYLLALKADVEDFAILQIGFCLGVYSQAPQGNKWLLYPYNFYTFSSEILDSLLMNDTIKWLRSNGFSFDRWIDEGIDFRRLADVRYEDPCEHPSKASRPIKGHGKFQRKNGIHHIIEELIEQKKPLVFHNGMLDILHIYDKFIGKLPESSVEISKELVRLFRGGIFDTKFFARYLHENFGYNKLRNTTLPTLHSALNGFHNMKELTDIPEERAHFNYIDKETGNINEKFFHEAGFDATIAAMV
ncbi:hypothetical protein BEWA_005270 [Theileria equi strain WA]|uniref:Uncharacterized protein n=1 Tax=Theileria equi strain WA TaxID=1537102 RepID=L0B1W1_THEEQ|nr:hypothetical protein BEWA_005270 [Theileria equi strain WA]AFZ81119.1 hypothetical protein BEWA_005270 [Theileria equi strain WA]|eukprot:XP_004830785.1 hypothetical protein BEWA_005270 [Theileria equi strain WA]